MFEAREQPERRPGRTDPYAYSLNISLRGRRACMGAGVDLSSLKGQGETRASLS